MQADQPLTGKSTDQIFEPIHAALAQSLLAVHSQNCKPTAYSVQPMVHTCCLGLQPVESATADTAVQQPSTIAATFRDKCSN